MSKPLPPWFAPPEPVTGDVAVVGAGIAGSAVASALARRGVAVTLIDRDHDLGDAASGNPLAGMTPRLSSRPSLYGSFQASAYLHAVAVYDELAARGHGVWRGGRGAFLGARDAADERRLAKIAEAFDWPLTDMESVDAATAGHRVGVSPPWGGLWFGRGGSVAPRAVCRALAEGVSRLTAHVTALEELPGNGWRLVDEDGATPMEAAAVVVAGGPLSGALLGDLVPPLIANRGQVSLLPPGAASARLAASMSFGAYLSPAVAETDAGPRHMLGASYGRLKDEDIAGGGWTAFRAEDHAGYLATLEAYTPALADDFRCAPPAGRASLRATTPDQLPIAGPVPDVAAYRRDYGDLRHGRPAESHAPATYRPGLFVSGGLGSRGFQTGPLAADVVADQMTGTPPQLPAPLLAAIHPARFLIRALRRGRVILSGV